MDDWTAGRQDIFELNVQVFVYENEKEEKCMFVESVRFRKRLPADTLSASQVL